MVVFQARKAVDFVINWPYPCEVVHTLVEITVGPGLIRQVHCAPQRKTSTATQHECVEHRNVDTSTSAARKTSECDGVQRMRVPSEQGSQTDSTTIDSLERNKHTIEAKLGIQLSNAMRGVGAVRPGFPNWAFSSRIGQEQIHVNKRL